MATKNPSSMVEKGMQPQSIVGGNSITKSGKVTELWVSCFVSGFAAVVCLCKTPFYLMLMNCYKLFRLTEPLQTKSWTGSFTD